MTNKKKQYEYNDNEMPNKIEKKHLYNVIRKLNSYFYVCYSNANALFRNSYGIIIVNKLSALLTIISKMYFADFDMDDLYKMKLIIKDIEFHIRLVYDNKVFSKKQITQLGKLIALLDSYIKMFMHDYELCQQNRVEESI